jgi:hypothetical protein
MRTLGFRYAPRVVQRGTNFRMISVTPGSSARYVPSKNAVKCSPVILLGILWL